MQPHFMVSSGDLYDTRGPNWSALPPLRKGFAGDTGNIESVADLKACLRSGSSSEVGGYPRYFICDDGESLSFEAVRDNLRNVMDSIMGGHRDGWRVIACDINWESELFCGHTGKPIASAYGSDESDVESSHESQ